MHFWLRHSGALLSDFAEISLDKNRVWLKILSAISTDASITFQVECEVFYLNRFMTAFNSTKEAGALHLPLKEYAANILVRF